MITVGDLAQLSESTISFNFKRFNPSYDSVLKSIFVLFLFMIERIHFQPKNALNLSSCIITNIPVITWS